MDEVMRRAAEQGRRALEATGEGLQKILDHAVQRAAEAQMPSVFVDVYRDGMERRLAEFEQALRDENLPDETVRRVMNRVQFGHPDGTAGLLDEMKGTAP